MIYAFFILKMIGAIVLLPFVAFALVFVILLLMQLFLVVLGVFTIGVWQFLKRLV